MESRVGVGKDGDPLHGVAYGGVVAERVDADHLLAELLPIPHDLREEHTRVVGGELVVARVEDEHLGVLADVEQDVPRVIARLRRRNQAKTLVGTCAPDVLCAPVPSLDRVRRTRLARVASQLVHERGVHAATGVQVLGLAMAVLADADHRIRAVLVDDATQLGLDDVERLIPADLDELRYAAVCGIDLRGISARLPVNALERFEDAVLRVDAVLVRERDPVGACLDARLEHLAVDIDLPHRRCELLLGVGGVVPEWANAQDLAIHGVDRGNLTARSATRDALECGLDLLHLFSLSSSRCDERRTRGDSRMARHLMHPSWKSRKGPSIPKVFDSFSIGNSAHASCTNA